MMNLKPFKDIIALTKEGKDKLLAPVRAKKIQAQANLAMTKIDEEIVTLESDIQEMCSESEINFDKLLKKLDDVAILERRKKQYEKVISQLFPE